MIKSILSRPMTVVTVFVLFVIVGLFTVGDIPVDLMPDLSPPYVSVATVYPSAGPEEVENEVTDVLEQQLLNISGLNEITSSSSEGVSAILLEFNWGDDDSVYADEVRRKVDEISNSLPEDAQKPLVRQYDPNSKAVMELAVQGQRSLEELTSIAEELIGPSLEQVNDVAQVDITGNRAQVVRVNLIQERLAAYGLSASSVAQALEAQNLSLGAGSFTSGDSDVLLTTEGSFEDLDDIRRTILASVQANGRTSRVYLRDVADVDYALEDETSRVLVNGETGINILVYKQSGSNTVEVARGLQDAVEELQSSIPSGVELNITSDSSRVIIQSMSEVLSSALIGVACSVLILLIFLRQARSTLIVAISIPVSIVITVLGMAVAGKTFNIVALTGLTLGVGMIVDASIVILENIYRHRQKGVPIEAAALFGTQEMVAPIFASILTTIAVFLPILIFGDEIGTMGAVMGDLAFTVILAMVSSLMVAVFLVPVLSGHYMQIHISDNASIKNPVLRAIDRGIESALQGLTRWYGRLLEGAITHRWATLATALLLLVFSFMQVSKLGINLMPAQASEGVLISVELPVGSNLEATKEALDQVEYFIEQEMTGYENLIQTAGSPSSREGSILLGLPDLDQREVSTDLMVDQLSDIARRIPGISYSVGETVAFSGENALSGSDATVTISGDDIDQLYQLALEVQQRIEAEVPELRDSSIDLIPGLPQVQIDIDRQKAFDQGIYTSSAATELRTQLSGTEATVFRLDGDDFPLEVRLREEDRLSVLDFEKILVPNGAGQSIPLAGFASLVESESPVEINHKDTRRSVTVGGTFAEGASANFVDAKLRSIILDEMTLPEGVQIEIGGSIEDIEEIGSGLLLVLLLAAILVFGVMVSQFESFKSPFIVILSMPMLALGVIGIYLYMGTDFSMISLIGVIMLVGIVVNNGIVLVDYITLLRKRGANLTQACLEGGMSRLRPILMTTLTTILAMVPLAFFSGEGGSIMQPLGITVVGGLAVNTVTTLVIVPVLYFIFFRKDEQNQGAEHDAN